MITSQNIHFNRSLDLVTDKVFTTLYIYIIMLFEHQRFKIKWIYNCDIWLDNTCNNLIMLNQHYIICLTTNCNFSNDLRWLKFLINIETQCVYKKVKDIRWDFNRLQTLISTNTAI